MHTETCLYNTFINRDLVGSPAGEKDHKYMIGYKREKEWKTDRMEEWEDPLFITLNPGILRCLAPKRLMEINVSFLIIAVPVLTLCEERQMFLRFLLCFLLFFGVK